MSTPPKRKHGHERDATQLASSGSIPTQIPSSVGGDLTSTLVVIGWELVG